MVGVTLIVPYSTSLYTQGMEYKQIEGYSSYRVGDDGSVWSLGINPNYPRNQWFQLATSPDKDGYRKVILCEKGKPRRHARVNVLVLEAFRGLRNADQLSAHNDGDRSNNALTNLRWATQIENLKDREQHGTLLKGEKHPSSKITATEVIEIRHAYQAGTGKPTELAQKYNLSKAGIWAIIYRRTWKNI
jgi:hypothetical protein